MDQESKNIFLIGLSFILFISLFPVAPLQAQATAICCVAGNYKGSQISYAKLNCKPPEREKFTMVIKQMRPCTASVGGTITDASGVVNTWTGTLRPNIRGCCVLEGSILTPGGSTIKLMGSICLKLGKWRIQGTWEEIGASDPCRGSGTWEAIQI